MQKETHLLELARYVVLNPVRAGMVRTPGEWPWSSYRAMTGEVDPPEWLERRWILSAFAATEADAVGRYIGFVAAGKSQPSPWEQLKQQVFLGSDAFVAAMRRAVPANRDLREVAQARARPPAKPLADYARQHRDRDHAIAAAYASGGYTMRAIGDYFGLHYSRVSKIVQAATRVRGEGKRKTP